MIQWPRKLGGRKPLVGWLNSLLERAMASELKQVVGGRLIENSDGKIIITEPSAGGGTGATIPAAVAPYVIKQHYDHYYRCRTWNGQTEGPFDVYVLKPLYLRAVPTEVIGGVTYTYGFTNEFQQRTATWSNAFGNWTEIQVVSPGYAAHLTSAPDYIYAFAIPPFPDGLYQIGADAQPILRQDANTDGRMWVRRFDQ